MLAARSRIAKAIIIALCIRGAVTGIGQSQRIDNAPPNIGTKISLDAQDRTIQGDEFYASGAEIDGMACALNLPQLRQSQVQPPICDVYALNKTTNVVSDCQLPSLENILGIELFDSKGWPVRKSDYGSRFGDFMTRKEIEKWHNDYYVRNHHSKGGGFYVPPPHAYVGRFSIGQAFKLKEAGEYTLRVRLALIQRKSGALGAKATLTIIWLPEVSAKVQIRAADLRENE